MGGVSDVKDGIFDLTVSPSARVRATLTRALAYTRREASLHYLRIFLSDPDPRVVANSVETFGVVDDPHLSPWLEGLRAHPHNRVRSNTLLVLARWGDGNAREDLRRLARSPSPAMRASADWAWAQLEGGT